jgi:hypothetical protein
MGKMGHTNWLYIGIAGPVILGAAHDALRFGEEYIIGAWEQNRGFF